MLKDKNNIITFFIKMVVTFIIFDIILNNLTPVMVNIISVGKYGRHVIVETAAVALSLVTIFLSKNTYIFNEKKVGFIESLKVGGFMLCFSVLILLTNLFTLEGNIKTFDLLSVIIFCLLIGVFEEFLCRGFIQNEFIERFSKNRKQVFLSIALSSLIFGGMHITNIWIGDQGVVETISQIIQATGLGILLGSIYYRTKNIWSCVFLHAFWDFAVFLGQINIIKDCTTVDVSTKYLLYMLISSCLFTVIYILISFYILRKSKTNNIIEEYTEEEIKKSEANKSRLACIIIIIYLTIGQIPVQENNEICYEYETKPIAYNEIIYPEYNKYTINENNLNLELFITGNNELYIKDVTTTTVKKFDANYIDSLLVIKNDNIYTIILRGLNEYQNDTIIYKSTFINSKDTLNTYSSDEYLDKIVESFSILDTAPTTYKLGYVTSLENNMKYPFLETTSEKMIIYENDIYILEQSTKEKATDNTINKPSDNSNKNTQNEIEENNKNDSITPNPIIPEEQPSVDNQSTDSNIQNKETSLPHPNDITPPKKSNTSINQ